MREKDLMSVGIFALVLLMSFIVPASFEAKIFAAGVIVVTLILRHFLNVSFHTREKYGLDEMNLKV